MTSLTFMSKSHLLDSMPPVCKLRHSVAASTSRRPQQDRAQMQWLSQQQAQFQAQVTHEQNMAVTSLAELPEDSNLQEVLIAAAPARENCSPGVLTSLEDEVSV